MSKKLLNEAEMRRFMGLAGIQSNLVSNRINEMYGMDEDEEEVPASDAAELDVAPAPELDAPGEPEMMDQPEDMPAPADDALDALSDEMKEELFSAVANAAAEVLDLDIDMEMGDAGAPEEEPAELKMDDAPEMPDAMDDKDEEEPAPLEEEETNNLEEEETNALEEENISVQLSEEEIVNEVARRVAKRLVRASKANKTLKEALGRK